MNGQVLVLNASYEPLHVVGANRAIKLLIQGKASALEGTGNFARSADTSLEIPYVLLLTNFVPAKRRRGVSFSRKNVLTRDRYTCVYCGKHATTIDHVTPRAHGGVNSYENCVASCSKCNAKKGSKTLEQMGWKLSSSPKTPSPYAMLLNKVGPRSRVAEVWEPYIKHYAKM